MTYRGIVWPIAALGMLSLAGGASAMEWWPKYAPRCPTQEMAVDPSLQHESCGGRVTEFGPSGTIMMSKAPRIDVEATGSISKTPRKDHDRSR
jgi:hypothetical protein